MKTKWTNEELILAVKTSKNYSEVLRKLGLKVLGGSYRTVQNRCRTLQLNTDHFIGSGWYLKNDNEKRNINLAAIPLSDILIKNSDYNRCHLKKRLIKNKILEEKCKICGLEKTWMDKPLTLHLDHIDGDNRNNCLNNLRLLCPNCHSQTETYCGKKLKKIKKQEKLKQRIIKQKQNTINFCYICLENKVYKKNNKCKKCASKLSLKIKWPSNEDLIEMVKNKPYTTIAKELGVSDNAIRRRLKTHCGMIFRKRNRIINNEKLQELVII